MNKSMTAFMKNANMSPRKIGLIAKMIRNMNAEKALFTLKFLDKKAARILYKLLFSAINNAKQVGRSVENLKIETILVNPGFTMKRQMPRARGRAGLILRRLTNIKITLVDINVGMNKEKING